MIYVLHFYLLANITCSYIIYVNLLNWPMLAKMPATDGTDRATGSTRQAAGWQPKFNPKTDSSKPIRMVWIEN
jgi:hypothetical protein